MRRSLGILGLTLALTTLPAPPGAEAVSGGIPRAAAPGCSTLVTGVDADRRLASVLVEDGRVTDTEVGRDPLPVDPTGMVYAGTQTLKRGYVLSVDATTGDGRVRRLEITDRDRTDGLETTVARRPFLNKRFDPRLFAGSQSVTVFTVDGGVLHRWTRMLERDGDRRYARKATVDVPAGSFTALQHVSILKVGGVVREYLVATTETGALRLLMVPFKHPERARMRTLATEGYAGVTELSVGWCDGDPTRVAVTAIDPVAGTATWTTIRDVRRATADSTRLRGQVTGADTWALHAVF